MDTTHLDYSEHLLELKQYFIQSLNTFSLSSPEEPHGREDLFYSYNRFLQALSSEPVGNRSRLLTLVFSSLVKQLDNAPDGEISQVLHLYLFNDFLENYSEDPAIQTAIEKYMEFGALQKLPLQIALSRRKTNTKW